MKLLFITNTINEKYSLASEGREKFKTYELTKISIFFHAFWLSHDCFEIYNKILLISIFTLSICISSREVINSCTEIFFCLTNRYFRRWKRKTWLGSIFHRKRQFFYFSRAVKSPQKRISNE